MIELVNILMNELKTILMNELINQIGKEGDNGDAIVDENSGEVIKYIDYEI